MEFQKKIIGAAKRFWLKIPSPINEKQRKTNFLISFAFEALLVSKLLDKVLHILLSKEDMEGRALYFHFPKISHKDQLLGSL